jgi:hypothetical protein
MNAILSRSMRSLLVPLVAALTVACGSAVPPPQTPQGPAPDGPPSAQSQERPGDPFALVGPVREEWMPLLKPPVIVPAKTVLGPAPAGLPPSPPICGAFVARKGAPACAGDAQEGLHRALSEPDPTRRDQMLADLESCKALPLGFARAVRAEMAPVECGEALTEGFLKNTPAAMTPNVYHALLGQAVASRLARAGTAPPKLAPPFDKKRVVEFTKGPMLAWFSEQSKLVQDVSHAAAELPYFALAITAIEAGMADMRLVEAVRAVPLPEEMAKDPEVRNAYYATLDQVLDPRKDRGRDAALVGLKQFAQIGALRDARVDRARAMLSRLYGGRKIDALDALLLPPLPAASPSTIEEKLAERLPTFYAGALLEEKSAARAGTMRMFAAAGVPLVQRMALRAIEISPDTRAFYARARLELGRLYWRAVDFDQAAALAAAWPSASERPHEVTLVLALSLALRSGPEDAAEMMRKAPLAASKTDVRALDAIVRERRSPYVGIAAFDAALIKQITAPQGADAAYWKDVAARFKEAAGLLSDPKHKAAAEDRASAAAQIAAAVR